MVSARGAFGLAGCANAGRMAIAAVAPRTVRLDQDFSMTFPMTSLGAVLLDRAGNANIADMGDRAKTGGFGGNIFGVGVAGKGAGWTGRAPDMAGGAGLVQAGGAGLIQAGGVGFVSDGEGELPAHDVLDQGFLVERVVAGGQGGLDVLDDLGDDLPERAGDIVERVEAVEARAVVAGDAGGGGVVRCGRIGGGALGG